MSTSRSILMVAQLAPPSELIAARRVAGLTKYLARLGHRVTVLTSSVSGTGPVEGAERVLRTGDLLTSPLNWRKRQFEALRGVRTGDYKPPSRLESVVVPDLMVVGWIPFALPRALALTREHRFDCVVTSSPPPSTHLLGLALRRRRDIPWIAEFRDGWTFEPPKRDWPFEAQQRADRLLERSVVQHADAVVGVTEPIVADLRDRLDIDARLITNAFDPEAGEGGDVDGLLDPSRHSLVHTGRMGVSGSTPAPFLEALRVLRRYSPDLVERLEVIFAGPATREEQELFAAPDLAGVVRWVGALEHKDARTLQRAADSLLVVTEGSSRRSVATGKLFEYLPTGRPILVLGEETEAARIVAETGTGFSTSATDPAEIAVAIRALLDGSQSVPRSEAVDRYSYPRIAGQLANLIDEVCAR